MKTRTNDVIGQYVVAHGEYDAKQKKWVMEFNGKLFEVGKTYSLLIEGSLFEKPIRTFSTPCTDETKCGFLGVEPVYTGTDLHLVSIIFDIDSGLRIEYRYEDFFNGEYREVDPREGQTITIYEIG